MRLARKKRVKQPYRLGGKRLLILLSMTFGLLFSACELSFPTSKCYETVTKTCLDSGVEINQFGDVNEKSSH